MYTTITKLKMLKSQACVGLVGGAGRSWGRFLDQALGSRGRDWAGLLNLAHSGSAASRDQLEQLGSPMLQNAGKHCLTFVLPHCPLSHLGQVGCTHICMGVRILYISCLGPCCTLQATFVMPFALLSIYLLVIAPTCASKSC